MTVQELKTAKPGDKILFTSGCYKGIVVTITMIDPPSPRGESRLEYDYRGKKGVVFSRKVKLIPA